MFVEPKGNVKFSFFVVVFLCLTLLMPSSHISKLTVFLLSPQERQVVISTYLSFINSFSYQRLSTTLSRGHNYKITKGRMIMNWKGCRRL